MAPFNPAINPTNDPGYLGLSKPISQPDADKSIGTAIAGVGNIIEAGAKAADFLVKDTIQSKVQQGVDSLRDAYTRNLDTVKTITTGSVTDDPANPQTLLAQNAVPHAVDNGLSAVQTLRDAVQAGKISPTYYYGRLNALAKNLRSQYPGYRDYIDKEISGMVGGNPANEYIQHLTADINSQLGTVKTEREKTLTWLRDNSKYDGGVLYTAYNNGLIDTNTAIQKMSAFQKREHDFSATILENNAYKSNQEVKSDVDTKTATTYANKYVLDHMDAAISTGGLTPDKINEIMNRYQNGELPKMDAVQKEQLLSALVQFKRKMAVDLKTKFTQNGLDATVDSKKIIDSSLVLVDRMIDDITNEKTGLALDKYRTAKNITADKKYQLQTDQDMGEYYTTSDIMSGYGPEAQKQYFDYLLRHKGPDGKSVIPELRGWFEKQLRGYSTQPDLRKNGNADTLLKSLNELKKSGINSKSTVASTVNDLVNYPPAVINNPKAPVEMKQNAVFSAYSPGNTGLFNTISKDSTDERGRPIPGRMAAFNQLFSRDTTDNVFKLGQEAWGTYTTRAKDAFSSEIFNSEINDLNTIAANPGVQLTWDTENHRWNLKERVGDTKFREYNSIAEARKTINRLNMGLNSMAYIAQKQGEDIDAYLLNIMIGMGFDPTKNPETLPEQMLRALITGRASQQMKSGQGESLK